MHQVALTTSPLLQEGLAVYMQERFGEGIFYPAYGRPLDLYAAGFLRLDMLLPLRRLDDPYLYTGTERATVRKVSRWQGFLQAGSFVRHLIERYGVTPFKAVYAGASYEQVYGKSLHELAEEWLETAVRPRAGERPRVSLPTDSSPRARKEFALVMVLPDTVAGGYTLLPEIEALSRPTRVTMTAGFTLYRGIEDQPPQPAQSVGAPRAESVGTPREDPAIVVKRQAASEALLRGAAAYDAKDYATASAEFAAAEAAYRELKDIERMTAARQLAEEAARAHVRRQRTLVTLGIGLAALAAVWAAGLATMRSRHSPGGREEHAASAHGVVWEDLTPWPDERS